MEREVWLPVVNYESTYEVSDRGRIRSRARYADGRIRKQFDHKLGYKMVRLHANGVRTGKYVHTLVLEAFVGPRPDGMYACHNDGDPTNNQVGNLRWDTPSANQQDAIKHGTHSGSSRTHCPNGHAYTPENTAYVSSGQRRCIVCRKAVNRRSYLRRGNRRHTA